MAASPVVFKRCSACNGKIPSTDGHSRCLLCLGEEHRVDKCKVCQAFTKQTRKNRASRLAFILSERALGIKDKATLEKGLSTAPRSNMPSPARSDPGASAYRRHRAPQLDTELSAPTPSTSKTTTASKKGHKRKHSSKRARSPSTKRSKRDKTARREDTPSESSSPHSAEPREEEEIQEQISEIRDPPTLTPQVQHLQVETILEEDLPPASPPGDRTPSRHHSPRDQGSPRHQDQHRDRGRSPLPRDRQADPPPKDYPTDYPSPWHFPEWAPRPRDPRSPEPVTPSTPVEPVGVDSRRDRGRFPRPRSPAYWPYPPPQYCMPQYFWGPFGYPPRHDRDGSTDGSTSKPSGPRAPSPAETISRRPPSPTPTAPTKPSVPTSSPTRHREARSTSRSKRTSEDRSSDSRRPNRDSGETERRHRDKHRADKPHTVHKDKAAPGKGSRRE